MLYPRLAPCSLLAARSDRSHRADLRRLGHNRHLAANEQCLRPPGSKWWVPDKNQILRCLHQWSDVADCFDDVARHEEETGQRFDWIIRQRPDDFWLQDIQPWCAFSNSTVYYPAVLENDMFILLPRRFAVRRAPTRPALSQPSLASSQPDQPVSYPSRLLTESASSGCPALPCVPRRDPAGVGPE